MSVKSERKRKRYAEDPVFRARVLATNRRFRRRHREEINERKQLERLADPEFPAKHHERTIIVKYGLAPGEYARMLAAQKGVCKFCKRACRRRLSVDHCHVRNMVRWLLCSKCNIGLGQFNDDPELLREAANCLDEWLGREVMREGQLPRPLTLRTAPLMRPMADPRCLFSMGPPRA
jgi:recombination endonuclease VII